MGLLAYGGREFEIEDRALLHLQIVMIDKLRRQESFSILIHRQSGNAVVAWINPAVPLEFIYRGNRRPRINQAWLTLLAEAANTTGLRLLPEPAEPAPRPKSERIRRRARPHDETRA